MHRTGPEIKESETITLAFPRATIATLIPAFAADLDS